MGNYHVLFLGGNGAERPLAYPIHISHETEEQEWINKSK